jgi:hypothetical protein
LNAAAGHYVSQGMCLWQSWYIIWGVSTNAWLNAVVMFEIHRMLKSSRIRKRYFPPTKRRVNWNALYVNLWTAFVASWGLYSFPWLPHQTSVLGGLTCNPVQHDPKSTLFLWLCFMPCFFLVPYFYAVYVAVDVWKNNLLPPKGRRRFIAIYFFRIVAVLVVMWGPVIICFFILAHTSPWVRNILLLLEYHPSISFETILSFSPPYISFCFAGGLVWRSVGSPANFIVGRRVRSKTRCRNGSVAAADL